MDLANIFRVPGTSEVNSITKLDRFLIVMEKAIISSCTIMGKINGVGLRVATAVVIRRANDDLYLYRRTPEDGPRRGIPGNWDTPKGRVKFVAPGKWSADENLVTGRIAGLGLATEYQPMGSNFEEFVLMPVIVFEVDEDGENYLSSIAKNVPVDMGDVIGYEWVSAANIGPDTAMTKILAALRCEKM
jgi:hypothetical protein